MAEASVLTARELVLPNGDAGHRFRSRPRIRELLPGDQRAERDAARDHRCAAVPSEDASKRLPVVIVVPGSLGVAPSHLRHAQTFVELGMAACVIDPFGRRGVTSTVSNQAQYSFAASAYDVLATVRTLAAMPEIDASAHRRSRPQPRRLGRADGRDEALLGVRCSASACVCTRSMPHTRGAGISSAIRMSAAPSCAR